MCILSVIPISPIMDEPTYLDQAKKILCQELANKLFADNAILFTHIKHPVEEMIHCKARIFVVPKEVKE